MSCGELRLNTDDQLTVVGIWNNDPAVQAYVNDADVELVLVDSDGAELTGQDWPLAMAYVAGSDGNYAGTIESTVVAEVGQVVTAQVTVLGDGLTLYLELPYVFVAADQTEFLWTSRSELESMFGRTNVSRWADLENNLDADEITARIRWSMEEATSDAQDRLRGSPVNLDELRCAPKALRIATTRLAGALLYESRGVKDTGDEEGKHRLSTHIKRADKWFQRVQAGVLRIDPDAERTSTPKVRLEAEVEECVDPFV